MKDKVFSVCSFQGLLIGLEIDVLWSLRTEKKNKIFIQNIKNKRQNLIQRLGPILLPYNYFKQMPRPKKNTCASSNCLLHTFKLKPISKDVYYRRIFKTKLCPTYDQSTKRYKNNIFHFNTDKKPYTNAFITQSDEEMYKSQDSEVRQNHEKNIEAHQTSSENKDIVSSFTCSPSGEIFSKCCKYFQYVPRPALKRRKYCHNCRCNYEEYLQHVGSLSHRYNLQKSRYFIQIKQTGKECLRKRQELAKALRNTPKQEHKSESTEISIKKLPITVVISPIDDSQAEKSEESNKSGEEQKGEEDDI